VPAIGIAAAEVVFTTNLSGYQELTDPSYRGQIVVMTATMIGNCGSNSEDSESERLQVSGVIARELPGSFASWRATGGLDNYLTDSQIPILYDVDTRRLTRHLRSAGVVRGVIGPGQTPSRDARVALDRCPAMFGLDLASTVTTATPYRWGDPAARHHVVAIDCAIKRNILRLFEERSRRVTVVQSRTTAGEMLAYRPDGVLLSNGPGDPTQ